jgi:flagellar protein FliS
LLLLYQGAIDALNRATTFMAAGNMADKGKQILKANDIINQFIASLDFEVGGELAHNLDGLYRFMLDQILVANVRNDPQPIGTVVSLLTTLKSGWEEAVASQRKRAVRGAA